jgi:hypothetical protein
MRQSSALTVMIAPSDRRQPSISRASFAGSRCDRFFAVTI